MQTSTPKSLSWSELLAALRTCTGATVAIRDGKTTEPAAMIRARPSAKGTELCLFSGEHPATRLDLIGRLETLAKSAGRRFMSSARASIGASHLYIESVGDEDLDGILVAVVRTRRPTLGFNPSQQTGGKTPLRTKRIKTN